MDIVIPEHVRNGGKGSVHRRVTIGTRKEFSGTHGPEIAAKSAVVDVLVFFGPCFRFVLECCISYTLLCDGNRMPLLERAVKAPDHVHRLT